VIRRYTNVGSAFFYHLQYSMKYTNNGSERFVLALVVATLAVEVPE